LVVCASLYLDALKARARQPLDWGQALAEADSLFALLVGSLAGAVLALALRARASKPAGAGLLELARGARTMLGPCVILLGAWALSANLRELGAGDVVAGWVAVLAAAEWIPALVFAAAALASFVTGTSWGTMAIVFPIAIPLVQGTPAGSQALELATVGAVLAGAVFGDHCSPISDTTIMSAAAAGCDPMAHVVTQLPYAVLVGVVSLGATLWVGHTGMPPVWVLGAGVVVLWLALRWLGHPADQRPVHP
jgi:Na+/H+ antiporter NhaC